MITDEMEKRMTGSCDADEKTCNSEMDEHQAPSLTEIIVEDNHGFMNKKIKVEAYSHGDTSTDRNKDSIKVEFQDDFETKLRTDVESVDSNDDSSANFC